jgi:hypothetical protein
MRIEAAVATTGMAVTMVTATIIGAIVAAATTKASATSVAFSARGGELALEGRGFGLDGSKLLIHGNLVELDVQRVRLYGLALQQCKHSSQVPCIPYS